MKELVSFDVGDGETLVVEVDEGDPGYVRTGAGEVVAKANVTLQGALEILRPASRVILEKIDSLEVRRPAEVEVEMGIKLNARTGAVLASAGGECHIKLKVTW